MKLYIIELPCYISMFVFNTNLSSLCFNATEKSEDDDDFPRNNRELRDRYCIIYGRKWFSNEAVTLKSNPKSRIDELRSQKSQRQR